MNRKLIFTILMLVLSFVGFGQGMIEDKCKKLKQQKIDFSQSDIIDMQKQIFKLMDCGFDSVDCKIVSLIVGNIMVNRLSQNGEPTIEYSFIISLLNQLKNSSEYALLRREIIYGNKIEKKVPAFLNTHQYSDYAEAEKHQEALKKPLLIYFTSKYSIASRRMEEDVLSDTSILNLLNDFIIITLYVDGNDVGKMNAEFQETKYKGNVQPEFINQTIDGKWTTLAGYVSKEEFVKFLNR
ncbi:MAG TPA: hypothetical protein VLZ83_02680 [Edaphocola sp.]|nr:hypothetical protein [Edaphocola sp.]